MTALVLKEEAGGHKEGWQMRPTKILIILALALILVWGFAVSAQASIVDFNITAPSGGTLSYAGGSAPFVGANIGVSSVTMVDEPTGVIGSITNIIDGKLGFTTGGFVGVNNDNPAAVTYYFDTGGIISLTGAIPTLGITDPNTILLQGSFIRRDINSNPAGALPSISPMASNLWQFFACSFTNWNDDFFLVGILSPNHAYSVLDLSFYGHLNSLGGGGTSLSGDFYNTATPVPPTALLLGSGLLALLGWRRLRKG
jgi:hypothetical protein